MADQFDHPGNISNFLHDRKHDELELYTFVNAIIQNVCYKYDGEDTINFCWEVFLNKKKQLALQLPDTEKGIRKWLNRIFTHAVIDRIKADNPAYRARKNQVGKVMRTLCKKDSNQNVWTLTQTGVHEPADYNAILTAGETIAPPRLQDKRDDREAQIPDHEMKAYLSQLIQAAGGSVKKEDLTQYVWSQYYCVAQKEVALVNEDGNYLVETEMAEEPDPFCPAAWHWDEAKKLLQIMPDKLKTYHYHRILNHHKVASVARQMGVAVGTVDNIKKEYQDFWKQHNTFDRQEAAIIIDCVSVLVKKENDDK